MSRIGNKPITVPAGVEVKIEGQIITVKGPKGSLEKEFHKNMNVSNLINSKKTYTGRYEVTPMADIAQVLNTNNKIMEDNVTVEKIPYAETSNAAGGYTVIIG